MTDGFDPKIFAGYNPDYLPCVALRQHSWQVWRVQRNFRFGGVRRRTWRKWLLWCSRCSTHKVEVFDSVMRLVSRWYSHPWDYRLEGYNLNEVRPEARAAWMDRLIAAGAPAASAPSVELAEQLWTKRDEAPTVRPINVTGVSRN